MPSKKISSFFEDGFPLEKPAVILPWNQPLKAVAKASGGVWDGDRYTWVEATYLGGLKYALYSENGITKDHPFTRMTAYVGLTPKGWSDSEVLKQYQITRDHLIKLFGKPNQRTPNSEVPDTEDFTWTSGKVAINFGCIEQFVYKCYLDISYNQ